MSVRKKPEKAVPILLARLEQAKEFAIHADRFQGTEDSLVYKFEEIEEELHSMKDSLPKIKRWEKDVMEQFCVLEHEIDDDVFKDPAREPDIPGKLDLIKNDIVKLKQLISMVELGVADKLRSMSFRPRHEPADVDDPVVSRAWVDLGIEAKIFESAAMANFQASFDSLESFQVKMCLLFLSVFPQNSVIKKRPLIYWWIGEGLVTKTRILTAEDIAENVFLQLINEGFVKPVKDNNKSPVVNSCMVYPWIRRMLILAAQQSEFLSFVSNGEWLPCNGSRRLFLLSNSHLSYFLNDGEKEDLLTVYNINEKYLRFKSEWLSKMKKVEVLQLGRWKDSTIHHIEVEDQDALNGLGTQKHLKYLSLRGISRIETLPPSIANLISLKILDLRACHNLEKLPSGISSLKNLTHLDVSECYLLESMPKGLDQLPALQVLKGFVIGNVGKNPCKLSDLARLKNLRKLSIRVGNEGAANSGEFSTLGEFTALRSLAISWGVIAQDNKMEAALTSLSVPPNLQKLDLRCVPLAASPDLLRPSKFPHLERLYIKGGKLSSLDHQDEQKWKVKIIRLKYLKNLKIEENELMSLFPQFVHLEKLNCHEKDHDIILSRFEMME